MTITATLINLYHVCKREMWLHANGVRMEQTSETVADGKLLHETAYPQRSEKYSEIEIGGSKIDFYDAKNKVIHEIKKSDSFESAHEWQVKYYIWLLEQNGVEGVKGIIEYPKLRETKQVKLSAEDKTYLQQIVQQIEALVSADVCPPRIEKKFCKTCSYFDFCWIEE
ncbi:CRISPR-associated protein Cas4 [Panacibacter ginsenosidivorans]|uniref:CRISPR-associated exonuclease Cas4 n=1 Tax=Panacibacter ginsenosidivorans TaxID=1813871 RepID=A0A5B8VCY2_9BACT|nr:CRISPR-associated protein Cas4 [Panacibacter ginsenosidivorans]QEC69324.1 CRISPR-associated protein Cas4 [Panacibacter ginsenosidivorans]